MKRLWVDTHVHISDIGPDGSPRPRMRDDLVELLDRCDADLRLVCSCDGPYLGQIARDSAAMLTANRMVHELVAAVPGRLFGSCMVNPRFLAESLRVMEVCFEEWGFVQLGEMLQYMMDYRMDSPEAERCVRQAIEYGVPVQVHLGTYWHPKAGRSGDGIDHLEDLLRLAERVPEATYILAHAIGCGPTREYVPWADMFLDVLLGVYGEIPRNFYIEIRDFHCQALPRTLAEVPADRLLSGTDWTTRSGPPFASYGTMFDVPEGNNPFPPRVASFVFFLEAGGAEPETVERIAWRNADELLRLGLAGSQEQPAGRPT